MMHKQHMNTSLLMSDLHVFFIVGLTLQDLKGNESNPVTTVESDKSVVEYASLYKQDGLTGGHVIMLSADALSKDAALEALHAYPAPFPSFSTPIKA